MNGAGSSTRAELRRLFEAARRWWWLLALGPIVVGSISYAASSLQPPLYLATAMLGVNIAQSAVDSDSNAVQGSKALTETYRQLIASDPVLRPVVDQLGLPFGVEELRDQVEASAIRDTQLLSVSVSDADPARAARIANAIADQFSAFIAGQTLDSIASSRTALEEQAGETERRIDDVTRQLDAVRSGGDATPPADQTSIDALGVILVSLSDQHQQLLGEIDQLKLTAAGAADRVTLIVPAQTPTGLYEPRPVRNALVGVLLGLVVAGIAVVLLEYLDDTDNHVDQARRRSLPFSASPWRRRG